MRTTRHRWLGAVLLLVLAGIQYGLWLGDNGVMEWLRMQHAGTVQAEENRQLVARNRDLALEVHDLKDGPGGVEERARSELGLIRAGETFYQVVEDSASSSGTR
jgi:cell division protein FtsB